jgi:hypothetical protein
LQAYVNRPTAHGGLQKSSSWKLEPLYEDWSWMADNVGTNASFEDLRPNLEHMLDTFPASPSNLLLFNWGRYAGSPEWPEMAFSLDDDFFYAVYIAWEDPADTEAHVRWTTDHMSAWKEFESGMMLADENLRHRVTRFMSDDNLRRLDRLREKWDPEGRFVSWLARPEVG